jgi:hypothetical protein
MALCIGEDDELVLIIPDWVYVAAVLLLLLFLTLYWSAWCFRAIPAHEPEVCQGGCRLPLIIPIYRDAAEYRCGHCASRWVIRVDWSLPRAEYRQWEPITMRHAASRCSSSLPRNPLSHGAPRRIHGIPPSPGSWRTPVPPGASRS